MLCIIAINGTIYAELDTNDLNEKPDYATKWFDILKLSESEQIKVIKNETIELFKKIRSSQKPPLESLETQILTKKWQHEKAEKNKKWLEELFNKGENFRLSFLHLSTLKQEISNLQREKSDETNQSQIINNTISSLNKQKEDTILWKKELKKDLQSRLANIPINIVIVGRIQFDDYQRDFLKQKISDQMTLTAIKIVNGKQIFSYTEVKDSEIVKNLVVKQEKGLAFIVDTYFQETNKTFKTKKGNQFYIYMINRIEVYPFRESTDLKETNIVNENIENVTALSPELYLVKNDNLVEFDTRLYSTFKHHKLAKQENEYIQSQVLIVNEQNEKVDLKIKEFRKTYQIKIDRFNLDIEKIQKDLNLKNKDLEDCKNNIITIENELTQKKMELKKTIKEYEKQKDEYVNYYQKKIAYLNRYEWRFKPTIKKNPADLFESMAENTYRLKKELQSENVKLSVWIEQSNDSNEFKVLKKKNILYYPVIEKFRILYLTFFSSPDLNCMLNIAYRVVWKKKPDIPIEFNNSDIIDLQNKQRWKLSSKQLCSYTNRFKMKPLGEWRIPTLKEIKRLDSLLQKYNITNINWPVGVHAFYITSDSYVKKDNGLIQHECYNFTSKSTKKLYEEDEVYILWVSKYFQ